jgi:WD40 repeat protein
MAPSVTALAPPVACPPEPEGDRPRCTLATGQPVATVALSPDGGMLVAAVVGVGVSVWRLPGGTGDRIDPGPPIAVPRGEHGPLEAVRAIAWRPDGREIALALEGRVLRYALPEGRLVHTLSVPNGFVREVAWWPDGSRIVVSVFDDPAAHVLDAGTGRTVARYAVEREATAIAVEPGAETVVVGSVTGTVTRFGTRDGARLDAFSPASHAVASLARLDDLLVVLGRDGVLRTIGAGDGRPRASVVVGATPARLAVGPNGRVAVGLPSSHAVVIDARAGEILRTLAGAGSPILAIAWHGDTLVTGDAAGHVAVWNLDSARRQEP